MLAGWAVPAIWLFVSLWVNVLQIPIMNAGYLGASVKIESGWWTVFIAAALGI